MNLDPRRFADALGNEAVTLEKQARNAKHQETTEMLLVAGIICACLSRAIKNASQ